MSACGLAGGWGRGQCRWIILCAVLAPACQLHCQSVSTPALPPMQPFPVVVEESGRTTSAGDTINYALYIPQRPEGSDTLTLPGLLLSHGFMRHYGFHRNNARFLAERGIVVLTPNLVSLLGGDSARQRNVDNTLDHIRWLQARSRTPGDALFGLIDPTRIALAGHSAGGAITFETTATWQQQAAEERSLAPPAALCLLDAVPWARTRAAAEDLQPLPFATLRSDPASCNANAAILDLLNQMPFEGEDVRLVGASHCDPENPTDGLCRVFCSGGGEVTQARYQQLLYLFLRDALDAPLMESPDSYLQSLDELEASGAVVRSPFEPSVR